MKMLVVVSGDEKEKALSVTSVVGLQRISLEGRDSENTEKKVESRGGLSREGMGEDG